MSDVPDLPAAVTHIKREIRTMQGVLELLEGLAKPQPRPVWLRARQLIESLARRKGEGCVRRI